MDEFPPSVKTSNGEYLERRIGFDNKSAIVNNPSGFPPPELTNSMQSLNLYGQKQQ